MENQVETIKYTPEKAKQNALAKLDLICKWQDFRRKAVNKLQADYDFVKLHNTSNSYLFTVLGKISRGSLHRWKSMLDGTEDYTKLLPQYKYSKADEYRTVLTDVEIKIFMSLLLHPNGLLKIENDISRQRREDIKEKGAHIGTIEDTYIFPMLGGRNIAKWKVKSNEFMLVPHSQRYKYGIPEKILSKEAPETYLWLDFYHDELLSSRMQNGKFFNPETQPFYRLDNVGDYTYSPYKVLWKEQTGSMSAVVVGSYYNSVPNADKNLFNKDKIIVVDSKVLMLDLYNEMEAFYVCGIINASNIIKVIDGYAISTNRGVDVLKYIAIPKYSEQILLHKKIADISKKIHQLIRENKKYNQEEIILSEYVFKLFT